MTTLTLNHKGNPDTLVVQLEKLERLLADWDYRPTNIGWEFILIFDTDKNKQTLRQLLK